jgi:hypothetical protein
LFLGYELAFGQYAEMFGNGLPSRLKLSRKGVRCHSLYRDESHNCSSCRVGDGLKNVSSHNDMKPNGCKSTCNRSVSQVLFEFFKRDLQDAIGKLRIPFQLCASSD